MQLTRLALNNFRNYAHLELDLTPGLTLLQGNNAQGKTNLLEAVFYLATAHSPHARVERELIRWGASSEPIPFARIQGDVLRADGQQATLEIVLLQPADEKGEPSLRVNKRIKVNGVNRRAIDLYGQLIVVLFLPEDLELVFDGPGERRKYLDTTLSQIDPRYGRALSKYSQVLEQRNSLLRELRDRSAGHRTGELDVWNTTLVEEGAYLVARRAETVERYNKLIAEIYPRLTARNEELRLTYQASVMVDESHADTATIQAQFERQLAAQRSRELAAGLTLVGPHRDELRFFADGVDMITYASRGQGRTIALSLKLAEVALMRAETSEEPLLLLDDVMSELDKPRRRALSEAILNASQAVISATDLEDFSSDLIARAHIYAVTNGHFDLTSRPDLRTADILDAVKQTEPAADALAVPASARAETHLPGAAETEVSPEAPLPPAENEWPAPVDDFFPPIESEPNRQP